MARTVIAIDMTRADYSVFADNDPVAVSLTSRQRAILSTALTIVIDRRMWAPINDSSWDTTENSLYAINELLNT